MADAEVSLSPLSHVSRAVVARLHEVSATAAYRHFFEAPFPRTEAEQRWRVHGGSGLVAVHDRAPLGFTAWSGKLLDALYVLPRHARCGVGSTLLAAVPAEVTRLWVLVANSQGRRFYERRGWVDTGLTRPAYEAADEVLYQR